MDIVRSVFAFTNMASRTINASMCFMASMLVFEWLLFPNISNTWSGLLRVFLGIWWLTYYAYWSRFYYGIYEVSELQTPVEFTSYTNSYPARLFYTVWIGHRSAFPRRLEQDKKRGITGTFAHQPNAILFPGDVLVVASCDETYKEMKAALRQDKNRRGLKWNNNFSLSDGELGFIKENGQFHNVVKTSLVHHSNETAIAP